MQSDYKWRVRLIYNDKSDHPGMLAEECLLLDDIAKDVQVDLAKRRKDVNIEVINLEDLGAL